MKVRLPNFIVAGFPKCGTSSLYYYLSEHPEIFLPKQKELHFFSQHVLNQTYTKENKEFKKTYVKDIESYQKMYSGAVGSHAVGDISPSYAVYPTSIPYIKKYLGEDVKIIIIIRDPIKRTFSNYLHAVREYRENMDFHSAILDEQHKIQENYADFLLYVSNSFYSAKIKEYKKSFKNILILTQEGLSKDPEGLLTEIYRFLDVDDSFIPTSVTTKFNEGGSFSDNFITRFVLKPNPVRTWITKSLPMTSTIKKFKKGVIKKYKIDTPEMDVNSEKYLIDIFRDDVLELEKMGINVSDWNQQYFK